MCTPDYRPSVTDGYRHFDIVRVDHHIVAVRIGLGGVEHMVGAGNGEALDVFVLLKAFADGGDCERNTDLAVLPTV